MSKPEEKEGEDALVQGKESSGVFAVLTNFRFLRFKPTVLVPVAYATPCSVDTSDSAVLALPFPRVIEMSMIPVHATKSTHIIFVCRTTTAKAPIYTQKIGCQSCFSLKSDDDELSNILNLLTLSIMIRTYFFS